MKFSKSLCLVALVFSLSACSHSKDVKVTPPVGELYNDAIDNLERGNYKTSIEKFEDLERTYPYSEWATKAELMSAYASYKDEKYDDALIKLERFTKLHPANKDVPYAYYLRALSFYQQISDVERDQSYTSYAKSALEEVIARFPDSKYANDARFKLDLTNDHLAGKEVAVGRFYQRNGNHIGAINRFQNVVKHYDTTLHVQEALHRLVESNLVLGLKDEAMKYAAVLGHNFPESKWYARSYRLIEGKKAELTPPKKNWSRFVPDLNLRGSRIFKGGREDEDALVNDIDLSVEQRELTPESINEPVKVRKPNRVVKWFRDLKWPWE